MGASQKYCFGFLAVLSLLLITIFVATLQLSIVPYAETAR